MSCALTPAAGPGFACLHRVTRLAAAEWSPAYRRVLTSSPRAAGRLTAETRASPGPARNHRLAEAMVVFGSGHVSASVRVIGVGPSRAQMLIDRKGEHDAIHAADLPGCPL